MKKYLQIVKTKKNGTILVFDTIVAMALCIVFCSLLLLVSCVGRKHTKASKLKAENYELLEWMVGDGQKACIWIDGNAYYGDSVENIAGSDRFVVYRSDGNDYLVLPDKIVVKNIGD